MSEPERPSHAEHDARGGSFYDIPEVFERYQERRTWSVNPNAVMEEPAVLDEIGAPVGLRVLDLGCGDAALGKLLLDAGATRYVGVDGSQRMIETANAMLRGNGGEAVCADMEDFSATSGSFDLVVSRLALHYVEHLGDLLRRCCGMLVPGGRLIFTVIHPVISSNDARGSTATPRTDWVVDNYFNPGPRMQVWMGGSVHWYHRTIEGYVVATTAAGFELTGLRECGPVRSLFGENEAEYERRSRIPMFLLLSARRPAAM